MRPTRQGVKNGSGALALGWPRAVRGRPDLVIALVLFALAAWQNFSHVGSTPFHPDETRWINRAHYIRDLFDPFSPTWDDQYLTRGQPPLGSYLTGFGLLVQGQDLVTNGVWDFRHDKWWNAALGRMSSRDDLQAGRRTNAVVGALTVVVVYFVGKRLTNRAGGIVAALFLALHPLQIYLSSQAMSDQLLVLLIALAALAGLRLAERPSWRRALLLGALLGLGGATKLSPLLVSLPLAGLGAVLLGCELWRRRTVPQPQPQPQPQPLRDRLRAAPLGWMLVALPVIAYATFVAVYPYLWPDPLTRTNNLFAFRTQEMEVQGTNWPAVAVDSRADALRRVGGKLGREFTTGGRLLAESADAVGAVWNRPPALDLPLAIVGAELFVALAVARGLQSPAMLALALLGAQTAAIVVGMRSDWSRYHLPILFTVAVCLGVVGGQLWEVVSRPAVLVRLQAIINAGFDRLVPVDRAPRLAPVRPAGLARPRPGSLPVAPALLRRQGTGRSEAGRAAAGGGLLRPTARLRRLVGPVSRYDSGEAYGVPGVVERQRDQANAD